VQKYKKKRKRSSLRYFIYCFLTNNANDGLKVAIFRPYRDKMLVETLINPLFCAVRYKMLCIFCDFSFNIAYISTGSIHRLTVRKQVKTAYFYQYFPSAFQVVPNGTF